MNRGAKIVIVAVVALFALTGIYYAFSSPKSRTTASGDADSGADNATGRISDPIAPGASVPQTLTMGPSSGAFPGSANTPPDAAFSRPGTGTTMPSIGAGNAPVPGSSSPSAGIGTTGATSTTGSVTSPNSMAPVIAPPTAPAGTAGTPRILPPDRTATTMPNSAAPTTATSINPPTTGTPPATTVKPSTAQTASAGSTSYTIKAGDTFSTIAGDVYKDTRKWTAIAKANPGVDPSRLKVGQVIKLPTDGAMARQATTVPERASAAPRATGSTHTVAKGETLAAIAERYLGSKAAWKRLYDANKDAIGSDPAKLKVGTKLVIPAT